jgi:hypothetical protein
MLAQTEALDSIRRYFFRELLRLSDENGYGSFYPLAPIASRLGIEGGRFLYDADTGTGLLWGYGGNRGENGMLSISADGVYGSVNIEARDLLENWDRDPLPARATPPPPPEPLSPTGHTLQLLEKEWRGKEREEIAAMVEPKGCHCPRAMGRPDSEGHDDWCPVALAAAIRGRQ